MQNYWIFVQNDIEKANILEMTMFGDVFNGELEADVVREDSKDRIADILSRRRFQKLSMGTLNFFLASRYQLGKAIAAHAASHKNVYIVFLNTSFTSVRYPVQILNAYKKKWPNIKYVLYYLDAIGRGVTTYANYLREHGVFDLVYSFDSYDARKYDLILWKTPYSKLVDQNICPQKDLYFIGVETDRTDQIRTVLETGVKNNVSMQMDIVQSKKSDAFSAFSGSVSLHDENDVIPYDEALWRSLGAKCILEIVRPKQAGLTLRPYEAVVYNRKLLTNNKSILSFPYYNPAYMQYFEKIEDIDWDWVKEPAVVDYSYAGDFSPALLLKDITTRLNQRDTFKGK